MTITIEEVQTFLETEEGTTILNTAKEGLINKNQELIGSLKTTKEELTALQEAEERRTTTLADTTRRAEEQRINDSKDFDAYKSFHEEEVSKLKSEISSFKGKYAKKETENIVSEVAGRFSKTPKPLELLLHQYVRTEIDDTGISTITVVDDKGQPSYFEGQPATITHLVDRLKSDEQYAPFFAGAGVSGSGTLQSAPGGTNNVTDMNSPQYNLTAAMAKSKARA